MNILILGGTLFVGRQLVAAALADGHAVSVLYRGKTKTEPLEGVEHLIGDRERELERLVSGRHWDVVLDTSCYIPRVMRSSLSALKERVDFYVFISTISVYTFDTPSIDEESNTLPSVLENPDDENAQRAGYGANKKACEALLAEAMPDRHLIARPGIITGPFDITSRVTYWLERLQYPGPVVTMRDGNVPVQWIDVRDLSEWVIRMSKAREGGTFSVVGPKSSCLSSQLYSTYYQIANSDNEFIYLPIEFVRTLDEWHWPGGCLGICYPEHDNFNQVSNSRAIEKGLTFRAARETFIDTYEWSMKWGHDYYYAVTREHSLHRPIQEKLEMERSLIGEYDKWRLSRVG